MKILLKSHHLLCGVLLCALTLMLFFIGRERASWRPQFISEGGIQIIEARAKRETARSQSQTQAAKQRFAKSKFDVWAVSPDGKWMACDYRKINIYDNTIDIRNAQSGALRLNLKFDNSVSHNIKSVEFSPNGNYLVIDFGYDDFRAIYDLRNGQRTWINIVSQLLLPPDENMVICVRLTSGRHGGQSAYIWTSSPKIKRTIRKIPVPAERILLPVWMDGPNHIIFGDTQANLWRVRVR